MPIYEYQCSACGRHHDILQRMSDPLATQCPACGQETLVKQVSAAGFRLKGSGWYETDFKTDHRHHLAGDAEKSSSSSADVNGHKHAKNDKGDKSDKADAGSTTATTATPATSTNSVAPAT